MTRLFPPFCFPARSTVIKNMGSTLAACGDVNRNTMAAAAPWKNRPLYVEAQKLANELADLLAPQSGAYYDVWLDGEKFVSVYKEVRMCRAGNLYCTCIRGRGGKEDWLVLTCICF